MRRAGDFRNRRVPVAALANASLSVSCAPAVRCGDREARGGKQRRQELHRKKRFIE